MRLLGVIAGFGIPVFVGVTSCGGSLPSRRLDPDVVWMGEKFAGPRKAGALALQAGDHRKAIDEFGAGARAAETDGDWISTGRFLTSQAAAHMLLGENRAAIRALLAARDAAGRVGDLLTLQGVEANLATVYVLSGDYDAAATAAGRGAQIRPAKQEPEQRFPHC